MAGKIAADNYMVGIFLNISVKLNLVNTVLYEQKKQILKMSVFLKKSVNHQNKYNHLNLCNRLIN